MRPMPEIMATVALLKDEPSAGLRRGQVGTIVEELGPDLYEVEFSDELGHTYASLPLESKDFLELFYDPIR